MLHGRGDAAAGGVDVARDRIAVRRRDPQRAADAAVGGRGDAVARDGGRQRRARQRVAAEGPAGLARGGVLVDQQTADDREVILRALHGDGHGVRRAIAQRTGEGGEVHARGDEGQRLRPWRRPPQAGIDATGIDPRHHRCQAGRLPVDADQHLAEAAAAATLQDLRLIVGHAGVPELVTPLALRLNVQVETHHVRGQRHRALQRIRRGLEIGRVARLQVARQRDHEVRSPSAGRIGRVARRIEDQPRRARQQAGVGRVDNVVQTHETIS